ncbi:MAG: type IV toxin-antitoxin system AbiEi family antitoxin domain-containing protein [Nitriliruptor sp.]|uniref:type IV toxin-antitoxin system AbiEi family antitoxin domain-containing protein n=1 Tax=Nitriliruptor sp. TaxID=2448056 RepID=UPI0034A03FEE
MALDDVALALLRAQLGVIGRRQLFSLGYRRAQVDAMVRRGQLEWAARGVYRRTGTPRTRAQDAMVALRRCHGEARVSGPLLLALIGCEGYEVEECGFTVLVPPGRRLAPVPFDWRPDPAPQENSATIGSLPSVTPVRNLLELAVDLEDDDALVLAADRLRWRTRRGAADLARLAADLPDHPGVPRLERLGLLDAARPESPGERDLDVLFAGIGCPVEWQVWVAPDLRVDALLRDCSIVIESDGPTHEDERDRARDAERDRRLEALGYLVVHVTAADRRHPEELRRRLRRLRADRLEDRRSA